MFRHFLIYLILIFLSSSAFAQTPEATTPTVSPVISWTASKVIELDALYRKGLARERLGAYDSALEAYKACLMQTEKILNYRYSAPYTVRRILPYAVAAAFRKGLISHRAIEGSVVKLYRQLQLYEDAEKWINEVMISIANLSVERGIEISEGEYGLLYFARAFNKAGWAYALLNGSLWRRYLVYTPTDTVAMLAKSSEDLGKFLKVYNVDYGSIKKRRKGRRIIREINQGVDTYFAKLKIPSQEFLALSLCFNMKKPSSVKQVLKKRLQYNAKDVLDLYYSHDIKRALAKSKELTVFEDLLKPKAKELFKAFSALLEEISVTH